MVITPGHVRQYPYDLWVKTTTEASQDNNGNWIPELTGWVNLSTCRNEPNGKAQTIQLTDNTAYVYDSIVYLPLYCPTIANGTTIEVRDKTGVVRLSGRVNRFERGQLNARLWV